jgi:hypothetical protein
MRVVGMTDVSLSSWPFSSDGDLTPDLVFFGAKLCMGGILVAAYEDWMKC